MQTHEHPISGAVTRGVRLGPGARLQETDVYDSTDGAWRDAGWVAGNKIEPRCETVWVRPKPLSEEGRTLLGYLYLKPWGERTCIGERRGSYFVIPSPTFNWDGRIDVESQRVQRPGCVQELVDYGYLTSGRHEATGWVSDYSTVWDGHMNQIYRLTDAGREFAQTFVN
jgi:hypothetical protein